MAHHQPKWRASRGPPLSPDHPFTALGRLFPASGYRGKPEHRLQRPGDKIDTVLATALREGAKILRHSTTKNCITRHRRAPLS